MPKSRKIPIKAIPAVLGDISKRLPPAPDPRLGAFIVAVVKDPDRLASFRRDPERALAAGGIASAAVDVHLLGKVIDTIVSKISGPADIASTVTDKETSSHQETNFDHGSSWFWNKDGYNVMYDQGHSSEKTSSQIAGQDKSFSGLGPGRPDVTVVNEMLGKIFFPSQPLVTPELIDHIKQSSKKESGRD